MKVNWATTFITIHLKMSCGKCCSGAFAFSGSEIKMCACHTLVIAKIVKRKVALEPSPAAHVNKARMLIG